VWWGVAYPRLKPEKLDFCISELVFEPFVAMTSVLDPVACTMLNISRRGVKATKLKHYFIFWEANVESHRTKLHYRAGAWNSNLSSDPYVARAGSIPDYDVFDLRPKL
jgi:hypothetical protein